MSDDVDDEVWRRDAACRGMGWKIFYPDKNETSNAAKSVCALCPVRDACLEYSLTRQVEYGVWGGTSQRWRRQLQKRRLQEQAYQEKRRHA